MPSEKEKSEESESKKEEKSRDEIKKELTDETKKELTDLRGSFWLTRIVIVRYMGFIYSMAFLVSLFQNKQLIGREGLLPANTHLAYLKGRIGTSDSWALLNQVPTLLWFVNFNEDLDFWLDAIAWTGLAIAGFMVISGAGNWPLLFVEWMLYHSLVNVGQKWFSFGWESQILETGFLTIFLCPVVSLSRLPRRTSTSFIVIMAYRWLIFRIMLGAGLIKIRGDQCWRDLTCMNYHYETQPVPNPLSYYLHQSPEMVHKFEVLSNHFVELLAPFFLLLPRKLCMFAGAVQILFQVALIISGNLSFLNWLTIVPSLACFDDEAYACLFSHRTKARVAKLRDEAALCPTTIHRIFKEMRRVLYFLFALFIAYHSIPVVKNLLSTRQVMNTSFDPFRRVNTYGAFGSVTKTRTEVIIQGTNSSNPNSPGTVWQDYEFKCKPGNVYRRPCLISPYHYRLDWLMWFAAFQNYRQNPWLVELATRLLKNDELVESLIAHNPFHGHDPPKFVRAEHYRYKFSQLGSVAAGRGQWWTRKKISSYMPALSLDTLLQHS